MRSIEEKTNARKIYQIGTSAEKIHMSRIGTGVIKNCFTFSCINKSVRAREMNNSAAFLHWNCAQIGDSEKQFNFSQPRFRFENNDNNKRASHSVPSLADFVCVCVGVPTTKSNINKPRQKKIEKKRKKSKKCFDSKTYKFCHLLIFG